MSRSALFDVPTGRQTALHGIFNVPSEASPLQGSGVAAHGAAVRSATGPPGPAGAASAVPLANPRNSASPSPHQHGTAPVVRRVDMARSKAIREALEAEDRRGERWQTLAWLRTETGLPAVRHCCWSPRQKGHDVSLNLSSTTAGHWDASYGGLQRCASVWCCPVDAPKIATARADQLRVIMRKGLEEHLSASFLTFTLRHHKGQRLDDLWDAVGRAWRKVTSGKQWMEDKDAHLQGWVRAVEVTHGNKGWHPHVHAVIVWNSDLDPETARAIGDRMWRRWVAALEAMGYDAVKENRFGESVGYDFKMASLDPDDRGGGLHVYLTKLAHEVTGGHRKKARGKGRAPFEILADLFDNGEDADRALWYEYEQASKGRRQLEWSRGRHDLRKWAAVEETTDEEEANREEPSQSRIGLYSETWGELRRRTTDVNALRRAGVVGGPRAAAAWLEEHGLPYYWIEPPPDDIDDAAMMRAVLQVMAV